MQSGPALNPGSLISESTRILKLVFQDALYAVYLAESTTSGEKIGVTEYFPADLAARAPSGEVLSQSIESQNFFNLGRDRFIDEAKALSALRHPNLLRFDGVASDHGTAYALHAPEEGQSITNFVKFSKQPPAQEVIDASLKKLASALDSLHSRKLIHANITPNSVLLRPDPLLIRFGATRGYLAARLRKINLAVTPGYSAPELHFSNEKAHGPLCDIFSFAAILYYVATGRHPIDVVARGMGQTMPTVAALASQRFRPQFLEAIDRGLELEPERRPPTIKAFEEMLLRTAQKAPEIRQPAPQMATSSVGGAQVPPSFASPPSSASPPASASPPPNGASSPGPKAAPKRQPDITPNETDDDEEDDDSEDHPDFGSSWRGLGIGRLLILALVLALIVSGGLWMLEGQFKKTQEEAARLDPGNAASEHAGPGRPASPQLSPAGAEERPSAASPSDQTLSSAGASKNRGSNRGDGRTSCQTCACGGGNCAAFERGCDRKAASQGIGDEPALRNEAPTRRTRFAASYRHVGLWTSGRGRRPADNERPWPADRRRRRGVQEALR